MIRLLLLIGFLVGCASKNVHQDLPFIPELTIAVPESELKALPSIETVSSEQLSQLVALYGVSEKNKNFQFSTTATFSGNWCGTVYYDDGFVPSDYLKDKPHITFKTLGVREEWIPINGSPKRFIVFKVVK